MSITLTRAVEIKPLSAEDGGGYLATVPSLPGCVSDGSTPYYAILNATIAIKEWIDAAREMGRKIPDA